MKCKSEIDRTKVVDDTKRMSLNEIYSLYESGKSRRYGLLFSVNGGGFAIASWLIKDIKPSDTLLKWEQIGIAVGMIVFTAIMYIDVRAFGKNFRNLGSPLNLFDTVGERVLAGLTALLILAWFVWIVLQVSCRMR